MRPLISIWLVLLIFTISACGSYTYNCDDPALQPTFIGYSLADVDTLYLRKYQANTNYATVIQTDTAILNRSLGLYSRHDSIDVYGYGVWGIKAGYDWELVLPAVNRTIRVSNILSEKRQGKCNRGIFSMDKVGCFCENPVYSVAVDNSPVHFSSGDISLYLKK